MNLFKYAQNKISGKKPKADPAVPIHSQWAPSSMEEISYLLGLAKGERIDFINQYQQHVWVYICTFDIAEAAASVPWKLFKKSDPQKEITSHKILDLLNRPNSQKTLHNFKFALFAFTELQGNAYSYLVGNNYNAPVSRNNIPQSMFILIPDRVGVKRGKTRLVEKYSYSVDARDIFFDPVQIIHHKNFNPKDEVFGQSTIEALKNTLLEDRHAKQSMASFYKNALVPSGVFSVEKSLSDVQVNRIRKQLEEKNIGAGKTHKPLILEQGTKWQQLTMTPKDVEFISKYKINREEILAAFGEPPTIAGIEGANYAESKIYEQIFWTKTIIPKVNNLIDTLNITLCPLFDDDITLRADISGIQALHESLEDARQLLSSLVFTAITQNEVREILSNRYGYNLPRIENGDMLYSPVNLVPVTESATGMVTE